MYISLILFVSLGSSQRKRLHFLTSISPGQLRIPESRQVSHCHTHAQGLSCLTGCKRPMLSNLSGAQVRNNKFYLHLYCYHWCINENQYLGILISDPFTCFCKCCLF